MTKTLLGMESKLGQFTRISDYSMQVYSCLSEAEQRIHKFDLSSTAKEGK
jgi:hypothetical protein